MKKFNYIADAGSLMLGTETFKARFTNGYGDGEFTVTIDENREVDLNGWRFLEDVEGKFNVYDYDCSDPEVLTTLEGRYGIYHHFGDMLLVKW